MQCGRFPNLPFAMATGPTLASMPSFSRPAQEQLAVAADRVRPVRVAVRVAPRPVLPGDGQFLLDGGVVGPQLLVPEGPVGADPVVAQRREVARVEARRVARVVHHRAADAPARVVGAQRHRVGAGDHPRVGPVEVMRAGLVADPVGVGVPERARVQGHDPPARPGQPLRQHRPAGAASDDDQVDLVIVAEPPHVAPEPMVRPRPVVRQQPRGLVPCAHARRHSRSRTGSCAGRASRTSKGSRASTPMFL